MSINTSEIFYSIQGEGPFIGQPAVFIRLSGCNLTCEWCDSSYTWKKEEFVSVESKFDDIKVQLSSYLQSMAIRLAIYPTRIIFTGGEPLLQQDKILEFLKNRLDGYYHIDFETNGLIRPNFDKFWKLNLNFNWIISPKIQFMHKYKRWWEETDYRMKKVYFKFVIEKKEDLDFVESFIGRNAFINTSHIYLMPEARTVKEQEEKLPMLIDFARRYCVNVTPRLHIMAYGNIRGV